MSTGIIVAIVVAVIVVAALVIGVVAVMRRRRLQQRFGPEYDRVAGERDSKLKADSELAERERRVRDLGIQPHPVAARRQPNAGLLPGSRAPGASPLSSPAVFRPEGLQGGPT
jgi:hypothetical protein